jgi:hypothetical protein
MITWIRHFPVVPCKSPWRLQNPTMPLQQQLITNFCTDNSIKDCFTTSVVPTGTHEVVSLVFNDCNFVSVQHIDLLLTKCLSKATKFLHLAVNKFLVYTEFNQELYLDQVDQDLKLISYWSNSINRVPVVQQYNSDDRGQLGNFVYPVTQIIWPVND